MRIEILLFLLPYAFAEIPPECPSAACKCRKVGQRWTVDCRERGFEQLPHFLRSYITWWELDLSKNIIDRLSSGDFQPFRAREVLLNGNGMVTIKQSALNNLRDSLQILNLADNNFHQPNAIEEGAFDGLTGLKTVYLQNNVVKSLPNAPSLENLNLDANTIKEFPEFLYRYTQMYSLSLKANAIENLPDRIFYDLQNLNDLDLTYNNIKSVNACAVLPTRVKAIYLDYNPSLQCDCHLYWLDRAGIKLSANETGLGYLCPETNFSCQDGAKYCSISPTDIPPRGSAKGSHQHSFWIVFISFIVCIYISKHHLLLL